MKDRMQLALLITAFVALVIFDVSLAKHCIHVYSEKNSSENVSSPQYVRGGEEDSDSSAATARDAAGAKDKRKNEIKESAIKKEDGKLIYGDREYDLAPPMASTDTDAVLFPDGTYLMGAELLGDTRAKIISPVVVYVRDGCFFARTEWDGDAISHISSGQMVFEKSTDEDGSFFEIPFDRPEAENRLVLSRKTAGSESTEEVDLVFHLQVDDADSVYGGKSEEVTVYSIPKLLTGAAIFVLAVTIVAAARIRMRAEKNGGEE